MKCIVAGSRLSGEIPSELGQLSDMKAFGASGGKFSGKMPSELGSLGNLASLDLGAYLFQCTGILILSID